MPPNGLNIPGVRRSPSGRIPQWSIDEAFGKLQDPEPWRASPTPSAGKSRRRRRTKPGRTGRWRSGPATVLGLALVGGLYFTPTLFDRFVLSAALPHLPGSEVPPPGFEAASSPLGLPPAAGPGTARGTDQLSQQSVAAVSAATGLQFVYDGVTSEAPSKDRKAYQPDRYGKKWAPVLSAWSTPEETPGLAGRVAGIGGSSSLRVQGEPYVYVTGQVRLDAPGMMETLAFPNGPALVRAIIMHELAHVVGLDHVNDPSQLMYQENNGQLDFGAGDRAGLALVGTGKCVPRI